MSAELETRIRRAAPSADIAPDRVASARTAVVAHAADRWAASAPPVSRKRGRFLIGAVALGLVIIAAIAAVALRHPPPTPPPAKPPNPHRAGLTLAADPLMSTSDWARLSAAEADGHYVRTKAQPVGLTACIHDVESDDQTEGLDAPIPIPDQIRSATYAGRGPSGQPAVRNEFVLWYIASARAARYLAAVKVQLTGCARPGETVAVQDLAPGAGYVGPIESGFLVELTKQTGASSMVAVVRDGNVVVIVESPQGPMAEPDRIAELALLRAVPRERVRVCEIASPPAICADAAAPPAYHFAGLPAFGAATSTPANGRLMANMEGLAGAEWHLYADGRLVWHTPDVPGGAMAAEASWVEQRLTPAGVRLVQSRILATGLFTHDRSVKVSNRYGHVIMRLRVGHRLVQVNAEPAANLHGDEGPSVAVAQIAATFAGLQASLPASAWADKQIRAFVPSYFTGAYERSEADLSYLPMAQLPARIRELLQNLGQACDPISLTSDEMRVLLETFEANGITPSQSDVGFYGFDLPGREQHPSFLHFTAAIPEDTPSSPGRCG